MRDIRLLPFPGALAGRYRPVRVLGSGGRSTVVEAVREDGGAVAVKLPEPPRPDADRTVMRRILAGEAKVLSAISDLRIPRVIEVGPDGTYIVLELLDNETMEKRYNVARPGHAVVFRQCAELALALAAVHESGYLHLDVKPRNVLFRKGRGEGVVLIDFGSARPIEKPVGEIGPHKAGSGKYLFNAPEQVLGGAIHFAPQTDAFCLGVTMYWQLAGVHPFSNVALKPGELRDDYDREYRVALSTLGCMNLPWQVQTICEELLDPEPAGRPRNLRRVADILGEFACA